MRLKVPAGSKVAPHWHPTDENLTVLQGTIQIGMGEKFDAAQCKSLKAGAYSFMPAKAPHYAWPRAKRSSRCTAWARSR